MKSSRHAAQALFFVGWLACGGSTVLLGACGASAKTEAEVAREAGAGADAEAPAEASATEEAGASTGTWAFHPVPGAICANGTPTGLGISRGTSRRIVVYMSGGSACLDERCSIGTPSMKKDGGFGAGELASCVAGECDGQSTFPIDSIFSRAPGASPFTDDTFVFVSNCSGDYYVGDNDHVFPSWTARFHGSRNQGLFAAAVAKEIPGASHVVLTGGSAGAVGALLNYWQWVNAFGSRRVDLVSDSFAFVFPDGPQWRYELHNPQAPPGCATCATDYRTVYDHNAAIAPTSSRIAVLDSENNVTLDFVSGYRYTQGLADLQPRLDALTNTRYYVANGNVHILFREPLDSASTSVRDDAGVTHRLREFIDAMQADANAASDWRSITCLPK